MMVLGGLAAARGSVAFGDFDLTVRAAKGADVAMVSEFSSYTWFALLFESTFAVLAGLAYSTSKTLTDYPRESSANAFSRRLAAFLETPPHASIAFLSLARVRSGPRIAIESGIE